MKKIREGNKRDREPTCGYKKMAISTQTTVQAPLYNKHSLDKSHKSLSSLAAMIH